MVLLPADSRSAYSIRDAHSHAKKSQYWNVAGTAALLVMDEVEDRVEAEMKLIEGRAKERVAQGLQDEELEREARKLEDEGKQDLDEANQS